MKLLLILLACAAYYYHFHHTKSSDPQNTDQKVAQLYKELKVAPVPATKIIELFLQKSIEACKDSSFLSHVSANQQQCLEKVSSFSDMCTRRIVHDYPGEISTVNTAKRIAHRFMDCVLPT